MDNMPHIVALVAVLLAGTAVILPIAGLTIRFALKPFFDSYARSRDGIASTQRAELLEQRVALLEEQMHQMEREQAKLTEAADFQRQLASPRGSGPRL